MYLAWGIPEDTDHRLLISFKLGDKDLSGGWMCDQGISLLNEGIQIYQDLLEAWMLDGTEWEVRLNDPVDEELLEVVAVKGQL